MTLPIISNKRKELQLTLLAAASLYFELVLIRFTSAEVLYLGYFSNFVLISAFAGLGLGFLASGRSFRLEKFYPFTLLFLFAIVLVSQFDVDFLTNRGGLFFFGNVKGQSGLPGVVLLPVLFVSVVAFFVILGQQIGRAFANFSSLKAYTLDIAGSLLGIITFSIQSFLWTDPVTWIITGTLFLVLAYLCSSDRAEKIFSIQVIITGIACVLLIIAHRSGNEVIWSTYQKLEYFPKPRPQEQHIYANGIFHQIMFSPEWLENSWYNLPYQFVEEQGGSIDDVLIIGAGSGTDVSMALKHGAKSIDAVEIDGAIASFGKRYNKLKPYDDPRVNIHITDGREFLRRTDKKYDLIIFALPDSLMRISSISNVRLESYLFTLEAFEEVKALLKEKGTFVLYNQYRWEWLKHKIANMLDTVFERSAFRVESSSTTFFIIGDLFKGHKYQTKGYSRLATDDWPNVYMQYPQLSWFYLGMIGMFVLSALIGVYFIAPAGALKRPDLPFFFMGSAFLLLETKSISFFSLLFGTTWFVNSLAFAGILVSVLCANLVVSKFQIKNRLPLFVLLAIALVGAYFTPPSVMLDISNQSLRYFVATVFVYAPIFLANLIFSREFRDASESRIAFGWNLLGAVVGGGLEYIGLVTGQKALLLLALVLYLLAGLFLYRKERA